jgi:Ca-activated chloride channel family protein
MARPISLLYPFLLLALGSVEAGGPLQQRATAPTLTVSTDLVTLAVTVVDRRGAPVTDLRQEHFTVLDDGERTTIQFFSDESLPATIGLVADSSGSMRGRGEQRAAVAAAFAALHHPLDEFFSLHFNEAVWPGLPPSLHFTGDPGQLRAALLYAPAQGMTALYDAVDRALDHLRHGTRDRRALIIVSDGGDNASHETLEAVLDRARGAGAVIYPLTFFDPDNRDARPEVLKTLARDTGGRVFVAKRPEDVSRSFTEIAREIRGGYSIGFAPAETSAGRFRPIRVVVDTGDGRQLVARTRAGYYAGPSRDAIE